ncbi:MAG TPA: sulfotransferase [Oleiagrimonas sp.]|nr:sulfotransferase [Oleiagrimonas sp.]
MSRSRIRRWERAQEYLKLQQLSSAAMELQSLRSLDPDDVRTHLLAAQIDWRRGNLREAAEQALIASSLVFDDFAVLDDVIATLRQVGETARAHEVFERFHGSEITSSDMLYRHAILCQGFGAYERALAAFDKLAEGAPDKGLWHFFRGQQLEFLGRFEEARAAYETCLSKAPGMGYAAYKLARLRPLADHDELLHRIDAGLPHVQPRTSGRADFEFARYHILEGMGRIDDAWQALMAANAEMFALGLANVAAEEAGLRRICERLTAQSIPAAGEMPAGPCPIFIVGMPRTGTTLLERMLANHSQVTGAGELIDFGGQLVYVSGHHDPFGEHATSSLATLDYAELGRRYLVQTAWRASGKAYFVDKQPTNWMLAGLIHAALPQAKILHIVRDPMDACFSIWRARFADAHAWSYNLDALAGHYDTYHRLMTHWKQTLPDTILDVDFAELVSHPAATLHKVMDFCGLDWEPGCEDPSRNTAAVSTLSSTQVREPVNTRGLGRWRSYERQLQPLCQRLSSL